MSTRHLYTAARCYAALEDEKGTAFERALRKATGLRFL